MASARFDIVQPYGGGHRVTLETAWLPADVNVVRAVSLNANGRALKGGPNNSGFIGVLALNQEEPALKRVDAMVHGEIVYKTGDTPLTAGTRYYAQADGSIGVALSRYLVGHTIEAERLIVHFTDLGAAPATAV